MSKKSECTLLCMACGHEDHVLIWDSINVSMNPELKAHVLDGSLFRHICPRCGDTALLRYPCLYHDMEQKYLILQICDEEGDEQKAAPPEEADPFCEFPSEYRIRYAFSSAEFIEKVYIFDAGLDDHILELYKAYLRLEIEKDFPEASSVEVFFYTEEGTHLFQLLVENELEALVKYNPELYQKMRDLFGARIFGFPPRRKVDRAWAYDVFLNRNRDVL